MLRGSNDKVLVDGVIMSKMRNDILFLFSLLILRQTKSKRKEKNIIAIQTKTKFNNKNVCDAKYISIILDF
jgi:hypothetical protein